MTSIADRLGGRLLRSRRFVRAPIWFYRHGLGWLFGRRVLLLEHVGRRSGQPRYVCLEIVERPSRRQFVVVSGFGEHAQWYRNLRAQPECRVSSGFGNRLAAHARLMSSAESAAALSRYQQAHPRAWRRLRGMIEQAVGGPVTDLPMVDLIPV